MPLLSLHNVSFHYDHPYQPVFQNLNVSIDSRWRTGVIGRNGRGKTTLLRLLSGELEPLGGEVRMPLEAVSLSRLPERSGETVSFVIRNAVFPFSEWEKRMEGLLSETDAGSLALYGEIEERYSRAGGYEIDSRIAREAGEIGITEEMLSRDFVSLSGGEKTRCMLAALFLVDNAYVLLDEPTNHLDASGREALGRYLAKKSGFLLVSHDRYLLDLCTDHTLSINRSTVEIVPGGYSVWKENFDRRELEESRRDERIKSEVERLSESARERMNWAGNAESEKYSKGQASGFFDKGYLGAKAARIAKRAAVLSRRQDEQLEEKKSLLRNKEKRYSLKFPEVEKPVRGTLARMDHVSFSMGNKPILRDVSLSVEAGDRLALCGPNGCGKTTLLRVLFGELAPGEGTVYLPKNLQVEWVRQHSLWMEGVISERLAEHGADERLFRDVLAAMGMKGDILGKDIRDFSEGERRKIELARSFSRPCHLLVWDEPLNGMDIPSREELEEAVLSGAPTLVFIEHDRYFIERVATRVVNL